MLKPIAMDQKPWNDLSLDFMVNLPESQGCTGIMVVVDRFSKMIFCIPVPKKCDVKDLI